MPEVRVETKKRPTAAVSFEVPLMGEIREVSEKTGIKASKIREIVLAEVMPGLTAGSVGHVHAMVMKALERSYRGAATASLDENS